MHLLINQILSYINQLVSLAKRDKIRCKFVKILENGKLNTKMSDFEDEKVKYILKCFKCFKIIWKFLTIFIFMFLYYLAFTQCEPKV